MSTSVPMTPGQPAHLPPELLAQDNSQRLLNVLIAFLVIETVFGCLFITSRLILRNYNGVETWCFMPLGYLFCIASCITGILMVRIGGVGRHTVYQLSKDPAPIGTSLKLAVLQEFLYAISITFPKLAIITLYLRIFLGKWLRRITWLAGVVIALNGISIVITILALCRPISYRWNPAMHGHCGDRMAFYRFASIPNIASDVAVLLLPLPTLFKLKMSSQKKAGVILTFLTGSLGIITAIIRFVQYFTRDLFADPLWYGTDLEIWTVIEPGAYFICACLPGLRPLIRLTGQSSWYSSFVNWLQRHRSGARTSSSTLPFAMPESGEVRLADARSAKSNSSSLTAKPSFADLERNKLEAWRTDDDQSG